jgi:hypothetical protein
VLAYVNENAKYLLNVYFLSNSVYNVLHEKRQKILCKITQLKTIKIYFQKKMFSKNGGANTEFHPQGITAPLGDKICPWGQSLPLGAC